MGQVAELMDHHIVQHLRRRKDQPVIEGEGAAGRTAAPAGLLIPDGNGGIDASGNMAVICAPLFNKASGGAAVSSFQCFQTLYFRRRQVYDLWHGFSFPWDCLCRLRRHV